MENRIFRFSPRI